MGKRKHGDRSKILLNEADVLILEILNKERDKIGILGLRKMLNISAISERTHIKRLVNSKFITKEKVKGENRYILNITPLGKEVLNIFKKIF